MLNTAMWLIPVSIVLGAIKMGFDYLAEKHDTYHSNPDVIKARIAREMGMSKFLKDSKSI